MMRSDNAPDDWNDYWRTCPDCGERYHASEGGCRCEGECRSDNDEELEFRICPYCGEEYSVGDNQCFERALEEIVQLKADNLDLEMKCDMLINTARAAQQIAEREGVRVDQARAIARSKK